LRRRRRRARRRTARRRRRRTRTRRRRRRRRTRRRKMRTGTLRRMDAWTALHGLDGPSDPKLLPDIGEMIFTHSARETATQKKEKGRREGGALLRLAPRKGQKVK
jgi:hypothetical protein